MIRVENKVIGQGYPCFVAAEIGINHNGDMNLAFRTIDAAVEAGADAIKFQNYYTEDFILDKTLTYSYVSKSKEVTESQYEMFKRYELSFSQLKELKDYCDKKEVVFFSTPTSEKGINDLKELRVPLLKNGSDFLVNLPLIKSMARTGIPLIISTGMAYVSEIDEAVRAFETAGGKDLIILHCTSSYPTPDEDVHLKKIATLHKAFNCSVGFSDHTWGIEASIGAVMLGAVFIEKHFTLDKALPGPDHRFSMDPAELKQLITSIRKIEKMLGKSALGPTPSEEKNRIDFRLSCAINKDKNEGETIGEDDIIFLRPATGIHPSLSHLLLGNKLKRNYKKGEFFHLNDLY